MINRYFVSTFGAVGDGKVNDGEAIQKAIDTCASEGGGAVVLESGHTYYASSIMLKDHVTLYLEKGSVLKASDNLEDYRNPNHGAKDYGTERVGTPVMLKPSYAFIYAKDVEDISIRGEGIIDGNAYAFVKRVNQYYVTGDFYPRPTLVYVEHCNHVTFQNTCFQNAPFWTLHPAGCDDVLVQNIRILNPLDIANSDGIDPDHCTNVKILGCHIECADDCICLKTTAGNAEYGPTRDVIIADCTLISTSAAIKIGTEGVADFENIVVHDCMISKSNRGISIQIRDGGNVRNVSFSNISIETRRFADCWWGCGEAIVLTTHSRDGVQPSGHIENIRFFNISTKGENGIFLHGTSENIIREIRFEHVFVELENTTKWEKGCYDLRPIPDEKQGILHQKSPAVLMENVQEISFSGCVFKKDRIDETFSEQAMIFKNSCMIKKEYTILKGFI